MEINVNGDIKKIDISNEKYSITVCDPHNIDEDVTYTFNIPYYNQPDLTILPMNYQKQIINNSDYINYRKEKELELKKHITKKFKYHITVLKVPKGYIFCKFDNSANEQIEYLYIDSKTDFIVKDKLKPVLEFESDDNITMKKNYIQFDIYNDKLIFNKEDYSHEYIHNGLKYIISADIFNKILTTYYFNNKDIIKYNEYDTKIYLNIKNALERDNTLMINILNKYGYVPNEPFLIDERWFTQLLDFNK